MADIAITANRNYGSSSRSGGISEIFGGSDKLVLRRELSNVHISEFQCNGTEVLITAATKAWLPISLSLFSFESIELSASAGTTSVKKRVFSLFGIL